MERMRLCDAFKYQVFKDGDYILRQNEKIEKL